MAKTKRVPTAKTVKFSTKAKVKIPRGKIKGRGRGKPLSDAQKGSIAEQGGFG